MPEYGEQDLKHATELREEIHGCALARVRAVCVMGGVSDGCFQRGGGGVSLCVVPGFCRIYEKE